MSQIRLYLYPVQFERLRQAGGCEKRGDEWLCIAPPGVEVPMGYPAECPISIVRPIPTADGGA